MATTTITGIGRLEMIIGCMFSGKSSELIRRIRQHRILGSSMLLVHHRNDSRYDSSSIVSHDLVKEHSHSYTRLRDVCMHPQYERAKVVFIEEAQFFEDLYAVVTQMVEVDGKQVVLSGLDGDYQRQPFEQITRLIPFAESVLKCSALCSICKDGTPGVFSRRLAASTERELVGGINEYIPVCRMHFR